jgi:hypothetical protein
MRAEGERRRRDRESGLDPTSAPASPGPSSAVAAASAAAASWRDPLGFDPSSRGGGGGGGTDFCGKAVPLSALQPPFSALRP